LRLRGGKPEKEKGESQKGEKGQKCDGESLRKEKSCVNMTDGRAAYRKNQKTRRQFTSVGKIVTKRLVGDNRFGVDHYRSEKVFKRGKKENGLSKR